MVSRSPVATYRIQLTPDFGFDEVIGVLPHIAGLGVSHLYLSPIGTAMPGSTHGYDWVPPPQVAEILGGLDGLTRLRGAATQFGLGIIIEAHDFLTAIDTGQAVWPTFEAGLEVHQVIAAARASNHSRHWHSPADF